MQTLRLPQLAFGGRERRSRRSALKAWDYAMNFDFGVESGTPIPKKSEFEMYGYKSCVFQSCGWRVERAARAGLRVTTWENA